MEGNLFDAVYEESIEALATLLEKQPHLVNDALRSAAFWGREHSVSFLLASGADVDGEDAEGYTSLHEAAKSGNHGVLRMLVERGADVNAKADAGLEVTPLQILANTKANNPDNAQVDEMARLLLANGAELFTIPVAAVFGTVEDVRNLIDRGALADDFLAGSQKKGLHIAAVFGNKDLAELLIKKGACVNITDSDGRTPLDYATTDGVTDLLLKNGAQTSDQVWDEIYFAFESANQVKFGTLYGEKLLEAVALGELGVVERILSMPSSSGGMLLLRLSATDFNGNTALHLAIQHGHKHIVRLLLQRGIGLGSTNLRGQRPIDIAKEKGYEDIVAIIEACMESKGGDCHAKS